MAAAQADLEAKYARVLAAYARDLAGVQALYERHKLKPPLPRNAPRVAGHILWARQLLRRIEAPMQRSGPAAPSPPRPPAAAEPFQSRLCDGGLLRTCPRSWPRLQTSAPRQTRRLTRPDSGRPQPRRFAAHKALLAAKDSRRAVRQFNRLATTLVKFEALWHGAWLRSVETSRAALYFALIVRHPQSGARRPWPRARAPCSRCTRQAVRRMSGRRMPRCLCCWPAAPSLRGRCSRPAPSGDGCGACSRRHVHAVPCGL